MKALSISEFGKSEETIRYTECPLSAISGAVSKMLAGIAPTGQIKIVSLVRGEQAKSDMAALGIENVIVTSEPDWKERVLKLTGGHTTAVAGIDSLSEESSAAVLSLLKDGGTLISFGSQRQKAMMIDPADVIFYNKKVCGFWATHSAKEVSLKAKIKMLFRLAKAILLGKLNLLKAGGFNIDRLSKAFTLKQLVYMLQAGKIHLPVAGVFPLSEYKEALALSEKPGRNGKVLFRP